MAAARGIHLRLLATSAKDYVHKAIVEEDARDDGSRRGRRRRRRRRSGDVRVRIRHPRQRAGGVLTLRVGKFPDTMEALVKRHLDKGDEIVRL